MDALPRRASAIIAGLAGLLSLIVFFRDAVTSGFDRMMGEPLDGYIQLAIVQHWDNVRRGLEAWDVTSHFHPWPDTLGYNDGFLLVGTLYGVARLSLVDPFVAQTIAFIVIRAIGFVFFGLFTSEAMGISFGGAVLGAALSTMASNLYIQSTHGQLLTVALAPLFAWLLFRAMRHVVAQRPGQACTWGAAASVLCGAWLLTAFYTIWFTLFLMLLTGLALLPFARVRSLLRWPVLVVGACFILAARNCLRGRRAG